MKLKETVQQFIKRKNQQFVNEKVSIPMKDIGRKGKVYFQREAWTFLPASNLNDKVFILERLKKLKYAGRLAYKKSWKKGEIEYRIGYYIVGKIGRARDKWVWGQFCPLVPHKDLLRLIAKAKKEKVIKE